MALLQDKISLEVMAPNSPLSQSLKRPFLLWKQVLAVFILVASGFLCGSLASLKDQMKAAWQRQVDTFRLLVLVQGSPLETDEVGRLLKQLEGSPQVTFVSSEKAVEQLLQDPLLTSNIELINPEFIPGSWHITWSAEALPFLRPQDVLEEIKTYPGVVDVAFDRRTFETLKESRVNWLQLKVITATLTLFLAAIAILLLGRLLFFTAWAKGLWKTASVPVAVDTVSWGLGLSLAWGLIGGFSWAFLLGGVIVGLFHAAWNVISGDVSRARRDKKGPSEN